MLIKCFLSNRKQRVVLNVQRSSWQKIKVKVPQGFNAIPAVFYNLHQQFGRRFKNKRNTFLTMTHQFLLLMIL